MVVSWLGQNESVSKKPVIVLRDADESLLDVAVRAFVAVYSRQPDAHELAVMRAELERPAKTSVEYSASVDRHPSGR